MRLIYLSILAVMLLSSIIYSTTRAKESDIVEQISIFHTVPNVSKLPVLTRGESFPLLSAQGVLAIDMDSGVVLYEKDADKPLLPASTTKIVTALTAIDNYDINEEITVENPNIIGQKMGLQVGEKITVKNLINAMLVYSANDAAEVLARQYPEGRDAFINKMNEKAYDLAMYDSLFVNPSGLEDIGHMSTARDLTRAALVAMENPLISDVVQMKTLEFKDENGSVTHRFENTNELLGEVEGVMGIKTGWTENARENLVTFINRSDKKVIIALLGSQDRFGETRELIDWIYNSYEWQNMEIPRYSTP